MRSRFGEFVLDSEERMLLRAGEPVALEPKVFDCIELLVSHAGRLTTKERVQDALWPDVRVGPGALRRVINEARRALGDRGDAQAMIRTRKGLGYVFTATVERDLAVEPPAAPSPTPPAPSSWPFVGRARELALLLERVASGAAPGLCFLSGEAGAGKSTLLARLRAQAPSRGERWLTGRCQAAEGVPAFWPFREVAEQLMTQSAELAVLPLQPRERRALRVIPELAGAAASAARADEVSGEERFEVCTAFAKLLSRLSEKRPLYIVIEDVHWADDGSLLMLETLAGLAREHPIAIFASYRPEAVTPGKALSQLIARTSGREGVTTVQLAALSLDDVRALLAAVRMPGSASGAAQVLHELTSGNALLIHEQVAHALTTSTAFDAQLPASLAHIVAQRVSLLPEATRKLLGQAAVLGHELNVAQLAALARAPREQVLRDLEPALREGVLRPAGEDPDQLRFRHALVGDALSASLPAQLRQDYHRDAFHAFQAAADRPSRSGELAVHAFMAGSSVPLATRRELCARAGAEAFDALAFDRASLHLGRAVRLLEEGDDSRAAAELALRWAKARFAADEPAAALELACADALERARRARAHDLFAEAALGHAIGFESTVHLRAASLRPDQLSILQEALDGLLAATGDSIDDELAPLRYRLAAALCWMRAEAGELSDFYAAARRAEQLAPRTPDAHVELQLSALRAAADPERSDASIADFLARVAAPALGARQRIEICILAMAMCLSRGDIAGYERARLEIERLAEALPQPPRFGSLGARFSTYVALPPLAQVCVAIVRGDLSGAEQGLTRLAQRAAELGLARNREGDDSVFYLLLQLLGYQGRCALLEPMIDQHLRTPGANTWRSALVQAQFAVERDDLATARERFAVLRRTDFRPVLGGAPLLTRPEMLVRAADVCTVVGDAADAASLYEQLRPRAHFAIHDGALICYGSASRALGALALQRGEHALAASHLSDALAMNTRIGHRPELARTHLALAQLALAQGRSDDARERLAEVRTEARAIGMTKLLAQTE
jgi:DNA-binding winged helix-turn-helix (wHTH) protein